MQVRLALENTLFTLEMSVVHWLNIGEILQMRENLDIHRVCDEDEIVTSCKMDLRIEDEFSCFILEVYCSILRQHED